MIPDSPLWSLRRALHGVRWWLWWTWLTEWKDEPEPTKYHPSLWHVIRWHDRVNEMHTKGLY